MAERRVKVKLVADVSEYTAGLAKAATQTRALGQNVEKDLDRSLTPAMRRTGERQGGLLARGINNGLVRNSPLIAAGVSAALAAGAPVALAGATALFGGIGAVAAAQSLRVRTAWTELGHEIRDGAVEDAAVLVPVYERMAEKIGAAFQRMRPELRDAFEASAPLIDRFGDSLTRAAENALPGLIRAVERGGPVIEGLGSLMEDIGTGISDFLDAMSDNSASAGEALEAIGDVLGEALPLLGEFLGTGSEIAAVMLPPLADALGLVADVARALGPVLPALVTGFAAMKIAESAAGWVGGLGERLSSLPERLRAVNAGTMALGATIGLAAGHYQRATELGQRWAEQLREGGAAAASAQAALRDFGTAFEQANSGMDGWLNALGGINGQLTGTIMAMDEADDATREWWASLSPLQQAQAKVAEWTETLRFRLSEYGAESELTEAAQRRLAHWTGVLEQEQSGLEMALDGVTAAMIAQADQALAAIDSSFAYRNSVNQLEDAQQALNDAIRESGPRSEEAQRAQLALEEQSYRTALAYGQQQADLSGLSSESVGYARIVQTEMLAELYRLHDAAGPEMQGAIAAQIRALESSGVSLRETGRQTDATRGQVNAYSDAVDRIPAYKMTQIESTADQARSRIPLLQSAIDNLRGRDIEIRVRAAGRFVVNPQGGLQEFAEGGWTGPGSKYTPAGIVHADEFVVPKSRVRALGGPRAVGSLVGMPGYAEGGPVIPLNLVHDSRALEAAMEQVANAMRNATPRVPPPGPAGPAGVGPTGGTWHSLWNFVKARVPSARINSTYRPGDPGYHGRGKAIDFGYGTGPGGAGSAGLALINRVLHDGLGRNLAELIYDGIGDDRPDLKNGRPLTYSAGTRAAHRNHVHAAVYDSGGWLQPGLTLAYNGTGAPERVMTSREVGGGAGGGAVVREIHHHHRYDVQAQMTGDPHDNARHLMNRLAKAERQAMAGAR